jgi:hypothetical protein
VLLQRQTALIAQAATGNMQLSDEEAKALNTALIPRVQVALKNGDRAQLDAIVRSEDAIACRQLTITEASASFANVEIESGDTPLILAVKHFDMQLLYKYVVGICASNARRPTPMYEPCVAPVASNVALI